MSPTCCVRPAASARRRERGGIATKATPSLRHRPGRSMSDQHFKFWPEHALHHLDLPATNVFYNLEVTARRHPHKPCLVFYDTSITFGEVFAEAQRIAGFL